MPYINNPVPGAYQFFPLNQPAIGDRLEPKASDPKLFQPLTLRNVTFKNRILVPPMCMYSAKDGHVTDWHLVHLGGLASRGVGGICVEATAVVPEGRISPEDAGIWADSHIAPFRKVVDFSHAQGTKIGIQLAHAGRKASCHAPWVQDRAPKGTSYVAQKEENGWPDNVRGPSELAYHPKYPTPKGLSIKEIDDVVQAFIDGAHRSEAAGFDFIEIHAAHGYLIHEFLSPISNGRSDEYGGSFENRIRLLLRIATAARAAWPNKPLFVRISATEWVEGPEKEGNEWKQWGLEQSALLAQKLYEIGVDLLDVSTGGNSSHQKIPAGPGFQVPFAAEIRKRVPGLAVGAVGLITEAQQAENYLKEGKADVIFLGRELLRNPDWPLEAAKKLGVKLKAANQYERAWYKL
ncbi:NADH:flavin oxidoreductase/NADH oxidase [Coprinopsis marcescibilis]|uniref:NADH:flavin oxidoreductase/NADH oxidase n=1 Tax=Coprinopsis marcescibilis TaxID=230819 RepID=A0A5C3LCS7_COPMA|nr:NADH:flavin oxidoreductase/NADH oxidase [Coprinopsis marcescibilis]